MADQAAAKKILSQLSKREDLKNKVCCDCSNPNPQWASLSFAIFICLQCAGTHRSFGVHISFVRSISMDTWQEEQIKRMELGGNLPFKEFMKSYQPADQGGYNETANSYDIYHCWAAAQYRGKVGVVYLPVMLLISTCSPLLPIAAIKLDALVAGKDWSPSAPPATFNAGSRSASPAPSAQALRKSRASARTSSPASSFRSSPSGTPNPAVDQKTANESYFAALGKANESRPDHLPPSQGGRYTGFGSTPTPPANSNPLSSANAPSLSELQENPVAAISKGWSLFAAAVAGASRVVNESVIQPGVEKIADPNFQASVKGYMSEAQKRATMVGSTANEWSKHQFGVDVADTVGGAVGSVRDRVGGNPSRSGYGSLSMTSPNDTGDRGLYDDDDDLFTEYREHPNNSNNLYGSSTNAATSAAPAPAPTKAAPSTKKNDWDDDWKDF